MGRLSEVRFTARMKAFFDDKFVERDVRVVFLDGHVSGGVYVMHDGHERSASDLGLSRSQVARLQTLAVEALR